MNEAKVYRYLMVVIFTVLLVTGIWKVLDGGGDPKSFDPAQAGPKLTFEPGVPQANPALIEAATEDIPVEKIKSSHDRSYIDVYGNIDSEALLAAGATNDQIGALADFLHEQERIVADHETKTQTVSVVSDEIIEISIPPGGPDRDSYLSGCVKVLGTELGTRVFNASRSDLFFLSNAFGRAEASYKINTVPSGDAFSFQIVLTSEDGKTLGRTKARYQHLFRFE